MAFDNRMGGFGGPRQMFDVSAMGLKCATCGKDVLELPFEPKADRPVYCRDCNPKRRDSARGPMGAAAPRQLVDVSAMNLKCGDCGAPITELPFEPKADRPVYCRDCNRNRRASFGPRSF